MRVTGTVSELRNHFADEDLEEVFVKALESAP
jgi:hypothetical protein